MAWSLQPDWKILLAAQQFEDASTNQVELTTFTSLVATWKSKFAGQSCTCNLTTGQFLQPSTQ
jgi:hypothetical protein